MRNGKRFLVYTRYPFGGTTYYAEYDGERLSKQSSAVAVAMSDMRWRTLREISNATGAPEASASARLRDLRKLGCIVDRRRRGDPKAGIWEYRVTF